MNNKKFEQKLKRLFEQDTILNPPPNISSAKYEALNLAMSDNEDLNELIENIIDSYKIQIEYPTDIELVQLARTAAYSAVIGLNMFLRKHKIKLPTKQVHAQTLEATMLYTFFRTFEKYGRLELEEIYDKL